jgi:TRAP-type uncharacterized transport system substrate-binding protein
VAIDHIVFVHEGMDEDLAYRMTKAVISDTAKVGNAVPALKTFDAKVAGTKTGIPLHKGAMRAYKELGLPYDEK